MCLKVIMHFLENIRQHVGYLLCYRHLQVTFWQVLYLENLQQMHLKTQITSFWLLRFGEFAIKNVCTKHILHIFCRYVIFYSPFDIVYKICKFLPCKIVVAIMKEIIRCKKINDGVAHAASIYPNSYLIMIIIGTVKGQ